MTPRAIVPTGAQASQASEPDQARQASLSVGGRVAGPAHVVIELRQDGGAARRVELPADREITLGRDAQCTVSLTVILRACADGVWVEDVSTNGALVGDQLVRSGSHVALRGSCITIRKFSSRPFTLDNLLAHGALSEAMGRFLVRSVRTKKNIVIAGGTGSGKTTLLSVLSGAIPEDERIVTIEDAAELNLHQPHVVGLEARPPNMEGKGEIPIRMLVKNALRMRPDRIVVGECRGGEALDMLQAMNTGHDGALTTTHANSPREALLRLETLALMAGVGLPQAALREQVARSVHLIVQQARLSDGSRKVTAITELAGLDRSGQIRLRPIFEFSRSGTGADGAVQGRFQATGYLPSFLHEMVLKGLVRESEPFL